VAEKKDVAERKGRERESEREREAAYRKRQDDALNVVND
jgi:hypothetical protein